MGALIAFAAGLVFGIGLLLSGMTDPQRILAFLDVAGAAWSPALMFVMGGAIAVALPVFAFARSRGNSLAGQALARIDRKTITPRLVFGSALFGVGWGLSGICPGPGLLIALSGQVEPLLFVASIAAGVYVYRAFLLPRTVAAVADPAGSSVSG